MDGSLYRPDDLGMSLIDALQRRDALQRHTAGLEATHAMDGVAPPGWENSIKRMKKHKDISNPWALAWWMKRTGAHPSKKREEEADAEFEASVDRAKLVLQAHELPSEYRAAAKGEPWAQSMLLDPNLPLMIVERR